MSKKSLLGLVLLITALVTVVKVYLLKATTQRSEIAQQQTPSTLPPEVEVQKTTISDPQQNITNRMSQLTNLARNPNEISLDILKDFILSPITAEDVETENILRTKAIEDIAYFFDRDKAIVALEKLEEKQKATFLGDQMRRLVVALRFKQPIVQHTELELRQIYQERMYSKSK